MHEPSTPTPYTVEEWPGLPQWFRAPVRLELATGQHLRPARSADAQLEPAAPSQSREHVQRVLAGPVAARAGQLVANARTDLSPHRPEAARQPEFRYALLDDEERELLGAVHLLPALKAGADADVWWWLVDRLAGSAVEAALEQAVVAWVQRAWPFAQPRFVGHDLTWEAWADLPGRC